MSRSARHRQVPARFREADSTPVARKTSRTKSARAEDVAVDQRIAVAKERKRLKKAEQKRRCADELEALRAGECDARLQRKIERQAQKQSERDLKAIEGVVNRLVDTLERQSKREGKAAEAREERQLLRVVRDEERKLQAEEKRDEQAFLQLCAQLSPSDQAGQTSSRSAFLNLVVSAAGDVFAELPAAIRPALSFVQIEPAAASAELLDFIEVWRQVYAAAWSSAALQTDAVQKPVVFASVCARSRVKLFHAAASTSRAANDVLGPVLARLDR